MKISKLFHWLYATLMFLPLVFFIPSVLYYGFNEHATNTETTTLNYKYESNEVNNIDDLVEGNLYEINISNFWEYGSIGDTIAFSDSEVIVLFDESLEVNTHELTFYSDNYFSIVYDEYNIVLDNDNYGSPVITYEINDDNIALVKIYVTYSYTDLVLTDYSITDILQYTDYNVIESVSVNTDDTIPEKVNRAWNSIWDLPLFAWTKTSFVAAPFSYITSLFGVGSDNSINYVFAYFVSISICWLVFDLIMYVPNLAHRWLDRSSLE